MEDDVDRFQEGDDKSGSYMVKEQNKTQGGFYPMTKKQKTESGNSIDNGSSYNDRSDIDSHTNGPQDDQSCIQTEYDQEGESI